ncbi:hypothetical protein EDC01DRAFT_651189 [Geopyxis carbonaria]|nr:hypothetical protein EDC01DRAFT_651189 [Geopyxis carbonaria]
MSTHKNSEAAFKTSANVAHRFKRANLQLLLSLTLRALTAGEILSSGRFTWLSKSLFCQASFVFGAKLQMLAHRFGDSCRWRSSEEPISHEKCQNARQNPSNGTDEAEHEHVMTKQNMSTLAPRRPRVTPHAKVTSR